MAKKLKNLEVTKVDFVDEGANQGANIKLFKRKDQNDNPVVAVPVQDPMKEQKNLFKRLMHSIGKSLGFNDEEIDSFSEPASDGNVQKGNSQTFGAVSYTHLDVYKRQMDWLLKHQNMLFPQKSNVAAQWFHMVQHRGQARYYKAHDLDMLLLGRRRADGNYVGKGSNIYTDGKGVTRYSPLSDWSHEAILAFIHYHKVPVPPIYEWKNGYSCGTHPWPARQWTGSVENGWKEVFEIDRRIVIDAAKTIPSAREFLEKNGK